MLNLLRPLVSRFIGAWVAALVTYLQFHYGITLDADTQAGLLSVGLGVFTTVYFVVHRVIDRFINKGDAASSTLAKVENRQVATLKAEKNNFTNYPE
jgi:hypothetical protein